MVINIFEGSRRIALLVGGIAAVGTILVLLQNDPYLSVTYAISHPNGQFSRVESCPTNAGRHYFRARTESGKSVSITLCLLTMSFGDDERQLIPYRIDDEGMIWGAASYSAEVTDYERALERRFKIPRDDETWINDEISRRYRGDLREGILYLTIGLAIFWGVVWSIGWIVRGFLGVPRGLDRKPQ